MGLVVRHGLHRRPGPLHPLYVAALSGILFWVGNSGILFGRGVGVAKWVREGLGAAMRAAGALPEGAELPDTWWEEMATFHFFGMFGNDCLFRSYIWVSCAEVRWLHDRQEQQQAQQQERQEQQEQQERQQRQRRQHEQRRARTSRGMVLEPRELASIASPSHKVREGSPEPPSSGAPTEAASSEPSSDSDGDEQQKQPPLAEGAPQGASKAARASVPDGAWLESMLSFAPTAAATGALLKAAKRD